MRTSVCNRASPFAFVCLQIDRCRAEGGGIVSRTLETSRTTAPVLGSHEGGTPRARLYSYCFPSHWSLCRTPRNSLRFGSWCGTVAEVDARRSVLTVCVNKEECSVTCVPVFRRQRTPAWLSFLRVAWQQIKVLCHSRVPGQV